MAKSFKSFFSKKGGFSIKQELRINGEITAKVVKVISEEVPSSNLSVREVMT